MEKGEPQQMLLYFKGKDRFGATHFRLSSLQPIPHCTFSVLYKQWSCGGRADPLICYVTSSDCPKS